MFFRAECMTDNDRRKRCSHDIESAKMHTAVDCYQMSMLYVMSKAWKYLPLRRYPCSTGLSCVRSCRFRDEMKLRLLDDLRMHSPRRARLVHLSIATSIQG